MDAEAKGGRSAPRVILDARANLAAGWGVLALIAAATGWAGGELSLGVPGPVLGLLVYAAALLAAPRALRWTVPAALQLVAWLGALIVPAAIGLLSYVDLMAALWLPLLAVLVVSTAVTALVTAVLFRWAQRR